MPRVGPASSSSVRRLAAALCSLLIVLASSAPALAAPTTEERAIAQALFDEGRKLVQEGRHAEACGKLEESHRLDPAIGTRFHLGDCYELLGRLASAWIQFVDVEAEARANGQGAREQVAARRAKLLEPRLTRLRIEVESAVDGLDVRRSGVLVPPGQWSVPLPVDAGRYAITARAPGHREWHLGVDVRGEGKTVTVTVPRLEPLAAIDESPSERARRIRGGGAVGLAVASAAALGVGAGAGIAALVKKKQADEHCPEPLRCYQRGLDLRDEARDAAAVATVGFSIGAGAALGAVVLWLAMPPQESSSGEKDSVRLQSAPLVGPNTLGGVFRFDW